MELVDVVLVAVCVLLLLTVTATLVSVVRGLRLRPRGGTAGRRAWTVALLVVALLGCTFLLGSAEPFAVGGRFYTDGLWLRVADMFILTSLVLILICSVIVVANRFRR